MWYCNVCSGGFIESLKHGFLRAKGPSCAREPWDTEIRCPKDGEKMSLFEYRDVELDVCSKCAGVWLDDEEVAKIFGPALSDRFSIVGATASAINVIDAALDELFIYY